MSPTNFTLFSKLPLELQLHVWEQFDIPASLIRIGRTIGHSFDMNHKVPAIFHACHTSRKVALQSHPLQFSQNLLGTEVWFPYNAEKDLLLFAPMSVTLFFAINSIIHFNTVRQIAIEPGNEDDYNEINKLMIQLFLAFSQIEKVHVLPRGKKTSMLTLLAEKDAAMDFPRVGSTLLHLYLIRVFLMRAKDAITEEEESKLIKKRFCVTSPDDFARMLEYDGSLKKESDYVCGCGNDQGEK